MWDRGLHMRRWGLMGAHGRLMFDHKEARVHCKPPIERQFAPGNPRCNYVAMFPESYDRCGWSKHCKVNWRKYGCWPLPKAPATKQNKKKDGKVNVSAA